MFLFRGIKRQSNSKKNDMQNKLSVTAVLLIFVFLTGKVQSQTPETKFGKPDMKNLQSTVCQIDSGAHAYYVFDVGNSTFTYNTYDDSKGFQIFFQRHLCIKILDNEGKSWGDISIGLYHDGNDKEEITELKGYTYNLEKGEIVKTKLEKKDILYEETSENIETTKLAMPNLKEGSVIELEYTVKSDFLFNLHDWYFQRTIPVMYSDYTVGIPEYFYYNQTQRGYFRFRTITGSKRQTVTFRGTVRQTGSMGTTQSSSYNSTIDYTDNTLHYLAENIPAFPKEKFLKTPENYLTKVDFELKSVQFPNQPIKNYSSSWEEIDKILTESSNFGKELIRAQYMKDDAEAIKKEGKQGEALMEQALSFMKKKIGWNGTENKYITTTLDKAYKTGSGNAADVNLNLVMLLKALGFNSHPLVLSTQRNGIIYPTHPSISSFNYVIAMVDYDGEIYLMDATDLHSSINLLPVRCLNDKGRIIGDYPEKWINLMNYKSYMSQASYKINLDSTLAFKGIISRKLLQYGAYEYRSKIKNADNPEEEIKTIEGKGNDFTIDSVKVSKLDSLNEPLEIQYTMTKTSGINVSGNMIYFAPDIDPFFSENPFKLAKREFPVEFDYPMSVQRIYSFTIPANYEVTELPKPVVIKMPDNSANFYYQLTQNGNTINVSYLLNIKKSLFLPEEYESLKQFFQMLIDKHNELIVLKSV